MAQEWLSSAIDDSGLVEIPLEGHMFTWAKNHGPHGWVEERLDRAFATSAWWHLFPQAKLINLLATVSDHSPICLVTTPQVRHYAHKKFKFENMWLSEPELYDLVHQSWPVGGNIDLVAKLANCADELELWGRRIRMRFRGEINDCKRKLEDLRGCYSQTDREVYTSTKERLNVLLQQEESYWKQWAKSF